MYIYRPDERPDVEVEVDGSWYPGELRGWWDHDSGRLMNVQWRATAGMTRIETVPAERVRRAPVVRPSTQPTPTPTTPTTQETPGQRRSTPVTWGTAPH